MTELFIYYRVKADRAEALRASALAMQDRLRRAHPHLATRLLRRPEATAGLHTWMETYASTDPALEPPRTAIEAEAAALAGLIEGARHVEVFIACAC